VARPACPPATRLNNDADGDASQAPLIWKDSKMLAASHARKKSCRPAPNETSQLRQSAKGKSKSSAKLANDGAGQLTHLAPFYQRDRTQSRPPVFADDVPRRLPKMCHFATEFKEYCSDSTPADQLRKKARFHKAVLANLLAMQRGAL
jgi:hypothetical protein